MDRPETGPGRRRARSSAAIPPRRMTRLIGCARSEPVFSTSSGAGSPSRRRRAGAHAARRADLCRLAWMVASRTRVLRLDRPPGKYQPGRSPRRRGPAPTREPSRLDLPGDPRARRMPRRNRTGGPHGPARRVQRPSRFPRALPFPIPRGSRLRANQPAHRNRPLAGIGPQAACATTDSSPRTTRSVIR